MNSRNIILSSTKKKITPKSLREKMSVVMAGKRGKGKKRDILDYRRDDFELLELQALREMFQIQFRKFGDPSERLLKVKYDVNRIIDDVRKLIFLGKRKGIRK
jgi:hypothetical protein